LYRKPTWSRLHAQRRQRVAKHDTKKRSAVSRTPRSASALAVTGGMYSMIVGPTVMGDIVAAMTHCYRVRAEAKYLGRAGKGGERNGGEIDPPGWHRNRDLVEGRDAGGVGEGRRKCAK